MAAWCIVEFVHLAAWRELQLVASWARENQPFGFKAQDGSVLGQGLKAKQCRKISLHDQSLEGALIAVLKLDWDLGLGVAR